MHSNGLLKVTEPVLAKTNVAAGTAAIKSNGVDCAACKGIAFLIASGTIVSGSVVTAKLQHSADDVDGNYADVEGSSISIADTDDDKVAVLDLYKPQKRWVRVVITITTQNYTLNSIVALRYDLLNMPSTLGTTVVSTSKQLTGAPSGTA